MPEGLEVELYRRSADGAIGRIISSVEVDERQELARELPAALIGARITGTRRVGKLLLLDLADAAADTLGIHFGMTGRLIVDGVAAIASLEYSSGRDDPAWDRFVIGFQDGGVARVNDPRRWARYLLDPHEDRLGPDFLAVTATELRDAFARRRIALKSVLLDQSAVAGYGNMCVDEVLWHAGLSPRLAARDLSLDGITRLVRVGQERLTEMLSLGGSHTGTIDPVARAAVPACMRDGAPMRRDQIGGRTTIWCPTHQTGG